MTSRLPPKKRKLINHRFIHPERRYSRKWTLILFGSMLMFIVVQRHVIGAGIVTDVSMLPTLRQGSYFLINKYIYHLRSPRRGEIVILRKTSFDRDYYVKRVIAVEGDSVSIIGGRVHLDGNPLREPYVAGPTYPDAEPMEIPQGYCFVLGDNRPNSEDSRTFGMIGVKQIEGRLSQDHSFPLD